MPKFCANLKWLFTELPFLERFEAAARSGFRAVEYASPYEFPAALLRETLNANGLKQVLINTPTGDTAKGHGAGFGCLPDARATFRNGVERSLAYADTLGCGIVHVQAGILPSEITRERAREVYVENLRWAAEAAGSAGVMLTIESVNQGDIPGFFLRTQEEGAALIDDVNMPNIGLQFDVYHCEVQQGGTLKRLEALMPKVAHVQIADAPGRNEPGTGHIAWADVFGLIDRSNYQGWVGCEYRPARGTSAGLGWLTDIAGSAGHAGSA